MELRLIVVDFIPHNQQRYNTVGDWQFEAPNSVRGKVLHVRVSQTGNDKANAAIAIHEIIEALLCLFQGVSFADVDSYDFHNEGTAGTDCLSDNPKSPYFSQHNDALAIEYLFSRLLDLDWREYDELIQAL